MADSAWKEKLAVWWVGVTFWGLDTVEQFKEECRSLGVDAEAASHWIMSDEGIAYRARADQTLGVEEKPPVGERTKAAIWLWTQTVRGSLDRKPSLPPRQWETYTHVLNKIAESNLNEVGMSRSELSERSKLEHGEKHGMSEDAARRSLDRLVEQGYLERTLKPTLRINKQAVARQRTKGGRSFYFYSVPRTTVPSAFMAA